MSYEQSILAAHERSPETQPTFNLENLEAGQVVDLVDILGAASHAEPDGPPELMRATHLHDLLEADIVGLPRRNPTKAYAVYMAMASADKAWPRAVAAINMGDLVRELPDSSDSWRRAIDRWVSLMSDDDGYVNEFARDSLSEAVSQDWLSEPTASWLNGLLPEWQRREQD